MKNQRSLKLEANHVPGTIHEQFFNFISEAEQFFNLEAKAARELDKGRGARTTSIKTLPTLVPLVMCFNCSNQFLFQSRVSTEEEILKQITNCILIQNKSLVIIRNQKDIHLELSKS
jgi:hypothetical protein